MSMFIAKATEHKGAFHRALHLKPTHKITNKDIQRGIRMGGKVEREAILARTLSHLRKH